MKRRIPRIVRLFDAYCQTLKGASDLPYEERQKLKAERLSAVMLESDRIKARRLARSAFTLVEMLVAVGLVVLMMALFAQIFVFATQSMATNKGTAENDQKVRLVMTLLRSDIANRTMQDVGPWLPAEDVISFPIEANTTQRGGYVYIAENDPDDDTDDILQLTVSLPAGEDPFYGAARVLLPDAVNGFYGPGGSTTYPNASGSVPPTGQPQIANPGNYWTNQPEFDDGILGLPNGAGSSSSAEVSYFLRKGTLYRRVLLIRTAPGNPPATDAQPKDSAGANLRDEFYGPWASVTRNFYSYFDYSGFPQAGVFQFHATNTAPSSLAWNGTYSLGNPSFRFGHNVGNGLPREFIARSPTQADFIGRFTHEETSFMATTGTIQFFGYPGKVGLPGSTYPNPMDDTPAGAALTYDTTTGKVDQYKGGSRIGEDILMTNVMRFDLKVWDDAASYGPDGQPGFANDDTTTLTVNEADDNQAGGTNTADIAGEIGWPGSDDGAFVDLGHNGFAPAGVDVSFYSRNKLNNATYCPPNINKPGASLYRFDTWCPALTGQPPFRAPDAPAITGFNPRRRPLKAIQIKITFLDPTTQQLRDITSVHSLKPSGP